MSFEHASFAEAHCAEREIKCACKPVSEDPMTFADKSFATYKTLMEIIATLDSIACLISGDCHSEPREDAPVCLGANVDANLYWSNQALSRVISLATILGVKN